jgi:DNA-binding transcriptional ArsR family regulator
LIRSSAYLVSVTLYEFHGRDELLAVRFACSPVWETMNAVRTVIDKRSRAYHEPWHRLVEDRVAQLDLGPLIATQPLRGNIADFLTPPPRVPWPRLRDQLDEVRATPPEQVAHELALSRQSVTKQPHRDTLEALIADPEKARETLAAQLHLAWQELVAPFWSRVRTLLSRDLEQRSRTLAQHGLRRVLDELEPRIRWIRRGIEIADPFDTTVAVDARGVVLMPSAYVWPHVIAFVDRPWQPTIAYPARGIAELWRAAPPSSGALNRLLGRTRALVLTSLDRPLSTTALAALLELSPAGASRHLLVLRDTGLVSAARHGHEVRYARTALGSALLRRTK